MVKFGKQLEAKLVQEWRGAYVDYKHLKRDIKQVKAETLRGLPVPDKWRNAPLTPMTPLVTGPLSGPAPSNINRPVPRRFTRQATQALNRVQESFTGTFDSVVAVTGRAADALRSRPISKRMRRDIIKVKRSEPAGQYEVYTTELSDAFSGVEASARVFFARLDAELNKVNHFYRKKEKEFIEHYKTLKKQVESLEEIRTTLKEGNHSQRHEGGSNSGQPKTVAEAIEVAQRRRAQSLSRVRFAPPTIAAREGSGQESVAVSTGEERDASVEPRHFDTAGPALRKADSPEPASEPMASVEMADLASTKGAGDDSSRGGGDAPERGDSSRHHMRLKIPLTTPGTTLRTLTQSLWEDLQKQSGLGKQVSSNGDEAYFAVTKNNVNVADKMLRTAFVEFYRGLNMLKTYGSLNMVAFSKVVKKFDKASGYSTLPIYIKVVESSYFGTSDKATILLEKVEALFAKTFAKDDRSKARLQLRPPEKRASHLVTFLLGLSTGGSLAFLVVFATLLDRMLDNYIAPFHAKSHAPSPALQFPENIYLKTIFPVFGVSALIIIHMFMYGFNVFYWRKWRINYTFMFDLKPGTELRHREVLLTASVLLTILLAAMVGHLALHSISDSPYVDIIPLVVFMLLVVLLLLPLNVFYRSSRIFLITCFTHLALAPLYKVVLPDFFLGDQLTSQVPMLRNLQYLICYYSGGFFIRSNADGCSRDKTFMGFVYLVSLLPYWWRFLQCLRRVLEEHDGHQLQNAGKYLSAMVAVGLRIQYSRNEGIVWRVLFVIASIVATIYQTFWDLYMDWGLLRKNSRNKWLRDDLIMPKAKYWYFLCMIANVVLRLAWVQSITRFRFGQMDFQVADFSFASLEVIRRGIWNFFRMENEHLNNVGKYRATKTVPLPFENPLDDDY